MTVPKGMQLHHNCQVYLEGQTVPEDAEAILKAAMPQIAMSQKAISAKPATVAGD